MSKFDKRKIAVTLACASLFSGKSQAMEKSSQPVAAVGGVTSKINSTTNKKGLSVGEKVLMTLGATFIAAEAYNEGIALARGDKPKTLFTGKYSFTELVRNRNKKKKPEPLKSAPNKGFEKGSYFNENTRKFKQQFSSNERAVKNFEKFQKQVLAIGVEGILKCNAIKGFTEEEVSKEDKTLIQTLESACKVISGQVPMNMSQISKDNSYYVRVESVAGNFGIYPGVNIAGLTLYPDEITNVLFKFSNIRN